MKKKLNNHPYQDEVVARLNLSWAEYNLDGYVGNGMFVFDGYTLEIKKVGADRGQKS